MTVQTVFQKIQGQTISGYSKRPARDVVVLQDVHHCGNCPAEVKLDLEASYFGTWSHADGVDRGHSASPRPRCSYCLTETGAAVQNVQAAWSNETRCTRCGGVSGYGIGD